MVVKRLYFFRPAIAMIELIFAIVIMGIVLLSAPILIGQSAKSNTVILQQESISMLAAHTNALMTYFWDEANIHNPNLILEVSHGSPHLAPDSMTHRDANISFPFARKRVFSNATTFSATALLGLDSGTGTNDVDDFTDSSSAKLLEQGTVATDSKYIDDKIYIDTTVTYGTDTANYNSSNITFSKPFRTSSPTSNVKLITTTLKTTQTADELKDKTIIMHAFMCNIGGARPEIRTGK